MSDKKRHKKIGYIIRDPNFSSLRSTKSLKRSFKKITRYDLSESKVSIPTTKKGEFPYFEMVDYEIFFFSYFFFFF